MQLPYLEEWSPRQRRQKFAWWHWSSAPRWLPQVEGWEVVSSKFPLAKIPRFVSRRTSNSASRWQGNNGTIFKTKVASLTWTCTQKQITLLPTSSEGLSIHPALLFTKDQTQAGNNGDCNRKETKAVNDGRGESNGGNMDRGPMMFTSDVSLPKDNKQLCWVNKLQLGNWQNYKRTAMLIMLQES